VTAARRRFAVVPAVPTDASLMSRIAAGDLGALGSIYDRYATQLVRFAARAGNAADAEDVVQTTFLRVLRRAATFDASAVSARPWLFAIASHVVQERRRSVRRWATALVGLHREGKRATEPMLDARSDLERALRALPQAKRTTLLLAEVEGFTAQEIASMLSIPVGTVWTRLHHARRALKAAYEGEEP
jgi:RNA polymerase sigma-70 factor (ECF subfamily)